MQNKIYHSGLKLRALRELKGLKEKELAEALDCEVDDILRWEDAGVPGGEFHGISDFFDVSASLFSIEVLNDSMLDKLTICELKRSALEQELSERLNRYDEDGAVA